MWLNHHLKKQGITDITVTNFDNDLSVPLLSSLSISLLIPSPLWLGHPHHSSLVHPQDGFVLTHVLHSISHGTCNLDPLQSTNLLERCDLMLQESEKIGPLSSLPLIPRLP